MTLYTVHMPPAVDPAVAAERAHFVPERFSWGAFVFGPLWFALTRSWLGLVLWVAGLALVLVLAWTTSISGVGMAGVIFLLALLSGFEANMLRGCALERRGFRPIGIVYGTDRTQAEHRFLQGVVTQNPHGSAMPVERAVVRPRVADLSSGIGMFGDGA